jgi:hypothetical protein
MGTLDCWEELIDFAAPSEEAVDKTNQTFGREVCEFYLERELFKQGRRRYLPWFRFHYPVHYYYDILVGLDVFTRPGYEMINDSGLR